MKICNGYCYKKSILKPRKIKKVDCIQGAFLGLDTERFGKEYYDERFFLFCEEMVLTSVVEKNGYTTGLICDEYYYHKHSVSINKSFKKIYSQRKMLTRSKQLFLREYLGANWIQLFVGKIFFTVSDIEVTIYSKFKMIRKRLIDVLKARKIR